MVDNYQDNTPKWIVRVCDGIWLALKVLMVLAVIAIVIWLRIGFDKWYVNWLID